MGFKFRVRFELDPRLQNLSVKKADEILAQQVKKDTEQFVPALTGSLSNRTRVQDGNIIYPGPYARFLYHGNVMIDPDTGSPWAKPGATKMLTDRNLIFNQSMHAKAQAEWFEASKALNLEKWKKVYERAVIKKR